MPELTILTHLPPALLTRVVREFPDAKLVRVPESGPVDEGVRGTILLTHAWGSPNLAQLVSRGVRWIHSYGTGVVR